jgi:hypothetical protein
MTTAIRKCMHIKRAKQCVNTRIITCAEVPYSSKKMLSLSLTVKVRRVQHRSDLTVSSGTPFIILSFDLIIRKNVMVLQFQIFPNRILQKLWPIVILTFPAAGAVS